MDSYITTYSTLRTGAPELVEIIRGLKSHIRILSTFPKVRTLLASSQVNILVNEAANVTGAMDFDEARVEAFGMCILGSMKYKKPISRRRIYRFRDTPWALNSEELKNCQGGFKRWLG